MGVAALGRAVAQDAADQSVPFLFVQSATGGSFAPTSDAAGRFTLTLQPVSEHTVYFADHPGREVGLLPTAAFAADVPFDPADPPNAALVLGLDAGEQAVVVLAADAWELPTTAPAPLSVAELPDTFGTASLFIDGQGICISNRTGPDQPIGIHKENP